MFFNSQFSFLNFLSAQFQLILHQPVVITLPGNEFFTSEDETIYKRECLRLETSLQLASAAGFSDIVVALHYPPLYLGIEESGFSELCEKYQVRTCIFGHVHGDDAKNAFQGLKAGTNYQIVAADAVDFRLQEI